MPRWRLCSTHKKTFQHPPDAEAVNPPDPLPQLALLSTFMERLIAEGSLRVADSVSVHPFASVTVTVYVPAASPVAVAEVEPVFQANV